MTSLLLFSLSPVTEYLVRSMKILEVCNNLTYNYGIIIHEPACINKYGQVINIAH
jgi:hypothetical protein